MTTKVSPADSPLNDIITKVGQATARSGYAIVQIDAKTREIIPGNALMRRLLGAAVETYEVKLDTTVEIYDAVETMRIFSTKENASIGFRISVTARSRHAADIVRVLASVEESPHERLMRIIREAIKRAADRINAQSPDGLTANIAGSRETWQDEMQRTISDRTGLEVKFIFEGGVNGGSTARVFTVRNHEMATRDAPHRVYPLVMTITLEPSGQNILEPLAPSDQIRIDRARQILGRQLPPEIGLYDLWYDRDRVEGALRAVLSNGLRSTGYTVASLTLEPISAPIAREEQVHSVVVWTGRAGRPIDFNIEAVLRLKREETGRFDVLHLPPRQTWLKAEAERALRIAMHGRDFEDLNLREQQAIEEHIIRILRDAARQTGQDIDPVVAKVVLPETSWLQRELLEVAPAKYPTRNALIDVEFAITVEISLKTLRPVIDRLRMRASRPPVSGSNQAPDDFSGPIREEVQRIVTDAARVAMAAIDADEYFTQFEPWPEPGQAARPVLTERHVKWRLIQAIESALRQRLDVDFVSIGLRPIDTTIAKIYQEIQKLNPIYVSVTGILTSESTSSADDMGVKLTVRAELPTIDKISKVIRVWGANGFNVENLKSDIIAVARQFLNYSSTRRIAELCKARIARADGSITDFGDFSKYMSNNIENLYGFPILLVDVDPIYSQKIIAERARNDLNLNKEDRYTSIVNDHLSDVEKDIKSRRKFIDDLMAELQSELKQTPITETETRNRLKKEMSDLQRERDELGIVAVRRLTSTEVPAQLSRPVETPASQPERQVGGAPEPPPSDPKIVDNDQADGGF